MTRGTLRHESNGTLSRLEHLYQPWEDAMNRRDPLAVSLLYAAESVLLPTLDAALLTTLSSRLHYFERILRSVRLTVELGSSHGTVQDAWGVFYGTYTFRFAQRAKLRTLYARFNFLFDLETEKIVLHHSAQLPESQSPEFPLPQSQSTREAHEPA